MPKSQVPWSNGRLYMTLLTLSVFSAGDGIAILSTFLRKNQRPLKLATLTCLDVLVRNYGQREAGGVTDAQFATIVKELPSLITEADLHVSQVYRRSNNRGC